MKKTARDRHMRRLSHCTAATGVLLNFILCLSIKNATSFVLPSTAITKQLHPSYLNKSHRSHTSKTTWLHQTPPSSSKSPLSKTLNLVTSSPSLSLTFTTLITISGAILGPFLDSYHSLFHVLQYDAPLSFPLWQTPQNPALVTTYWVPYLFGLAGFIIGWLYIILDEILQTPTSKKCPSPFLILTGISFFTFQYYASGLLYSMNWTRNDILTVMTTLSTIGYFVFDNTTPGLIASFATAIGGPLIEVGLITTLKGSDVGYHYTDLGETGFFPFWIVPVYFLGGPAVGNLSRGIWTSLQKYLPSTTQQPSLEQPKEKPNCKYCNDTRAVGCPNCDATGYYVTYNRRVKCNCCKGRGLVICRKCFNDYDDDPNDLEKIREIMSKMPD